MKSVTLSNKLNNLFKISKRHFQQKVQMQKPRHAVPIAWPVNRFEAVPQRAMAQRATPGSV